MINFYPNVSAICVSAHSLSFLHFHVSQNFHDFRSMLYDLCFFRCDVKNTVMSVCCDFLGVSESKFFSVGSFGLKSLVGPTEDFKDPPNPPQSDALISKGALVATESQVRGHRRVRTACARVHQGMQRCSIALTRHPPSAGAKMKIACSDLHVHMSVSVSVCISLQLCA